MVLANFILALDNHPTRRNAFLEQAQQAIVASAEQKTCHHQFGDLAMAWCLGKHAPWSAHGTADALTTLAGHAIDRSGQWLTAEQLAARWGNEHMAQPSAAFDGYHLAVGYRKAAQLVVEADLLGFFPVYYWNENGVLLVTSSCELLPAHPAFRMRADLQGLVGMLMINGLVANRTVLTGVRRLSPGHRLIGEPQVGGGFAAREQLQYRMAASDRFAKATLAELVEIADTAMRRAVTRLTPAGMQTSQLVSGGLDSRLVTGYIGQSGIRCTGICLGQPYDFEAQAAESVARALDFPFQLVREEMEPTEFVASAKQRVRQLQLSAGIGCGELDDAKAALQATAPCFWSGISIDDLLGGGGLGYGFDQNTCNWSFERFALDTAKWGIKPAQLSQLLGTNDGAEIVAAVEQAFEQDFHSTNDDTSRLVYRARLKNRHRYHLGNSVWLLSFASWPLLFVADREWLETMFDLPPAFAMRKKLEMEMLRTKFPQLLQAPLDVNSWHHGWVNPSAGYRVRQRLNKIVPVERLWHDFYWRRWRGTDRRRYWRFYDFDGPKWRAVRQFAEPTRGRLEAWFNPSEVAAFLPAPQTRLPKNNAFGDAACRRNLLGVAIWSAEFFD